jgi:histidinol-phosphate phosphatase family protein
MSNTPSSPPSNSSTSSGPQALVDEIVAARVGRQWCLFLDRDGVLNRRVVGDYVRSWSDIEWLPGVHAALPELRQWAPYVVVVTNQQGIGKGLMSSGDVTEIHLRLQAELADQGVVIDEFLVCPHLESDGCDCRKPKPGLVLDWLARHRDCEAELSVMVGDSPSDLEMAHNVAAVTGGCIGIGIGGRTGVAALADAVWDSLGDFAVAVGQARGTTGLCQ